MSRSGVGARVAILALVVAVTAGCPADQQDPSPEQAQAQLIAAAGQIAGTLGLSGLRPRFVAGWCGPTGRGRFRPTAVITLPAALRDAQARDELAGHLARLRRAGWSPDPAFHSHLPALERDGIRVLFGGGGTGVRLIEVLGECA